MAKAWDGTPQPGGKHPQADPHGPVGPSSAAGVVDGDAGADGTLSSFMSRSLSQLGQTGAGSLPRISSSNSCSQSRHRYSYSGTASSPVNKGRGGGFGRGGLSGRGRRR